jgi:hypothetical protein
VSRALPGCLLQENARVGLYDRNTHAGALQHTTNNSDQQANTHTAGHLYASTVYAPYAVTHLHQTHHRHSR